MLDQQGGKYGKCTLPARRVKSLPGAAPKMLSKVDERNIDEMWITSSILDDVKVQVFAKDRVYDFVDLRLYYNWFNYCYIYVN